MIEILATDEFAFVAFEALIELARIEAPQHLLRAALQGLVIVSYFATQPVFPAPLSFT
jgi:hypothetical protein